MYFPYIQQQRIQCSVTKHCGDYHCCSANAPLHSVRAVELRDTVSSIAILSAGYQTLYLENQTYVGLHLKRPKLR